MIILKNLNGKEVVRTHFRNKDIVIRPKHSYIIESGDKLEDRDLAEHIVSNFGFVVDITKRMEEEKGVKE